MEQIFIWLTMSLYGSLTIALLSAFLWGIASIVLSPCHLSGIPLMIAFLTGDKKLDIEKAFRFSLIFSLGIYKIEKTCLKFVNTWHSNLLGYYFTA